MWIYKKEEKDIVKNELSKWFKNDIQIASNLCEVYYNLTDKWFEVYIWEYIRKIHNFDIEIIWWKKDWWIDIIGNRIINWNEQKIYVQCKQRHWASKKRHITEKNLKEFIWSTHKFKNNNNVFLYYITTSRFTPNAKKYAKENNIIIKDYKDIAREIYNNYSLEEFNKFIMYWNHKFVINDLLENNYIDYIDQKENIKIWIKKEINDLNEEIKNNYKNNENDENLKKEYINIFNKNIKENIKKINELKKNEIYKPKYKIKYKNIFILVLIIILYLIFFWEKKQSINEIQNVNYSKINENNYIENLDYKVIKNNKKNIK